jgi:hypothetical protein
LAASEVLRFRDNRITANKPAAIMPRATQIEPFCCHNVVLTFSALVPMACGGKTGEEFRQGFDGVHQVPDGHCCQEEPSNMLSLNLTC